MYNRRCIPCKNDPRLRRQAHRQDFIRKNALSLLSHKKQASFLVEKNFRPFSDFNVAQLSQKTNLDRRQMINLYTIFCAMYLFQHFESKKDDVEGDYFNPKKKTVDI